MYVCMHACMHACMHTYMHAHSDMQNTPQETNKRPHECVYICIYTYVCIYVERGRDIICIHIMYYMCIYVYACAYAYICVYIYIMYTSISYDGRFFLKHMYVHEYRGLLLGGQRLSETFLKLSSLIQNPTRNSRYPLTPPNQTKTVSSYNEKNIE